jgi:lipocalin
MAGAELFGYGRGEEWLIAPMAAVRATVALLATLGLTVCRSMAAIEPIPPIAHVNLARYMGRWRLIAAIPTGNRARLP